MKRVSRLAKTRPSHIKPMLVRKPSALLAIRESHGGAFMAAVNGTLNVEEYLRLESLQEH